MAKTTESEAETKFAPHDKLLLEGAGFLNPRADSTKKDYQEDLQSLADDIAERKLTTPLVVWEAYEDGSPLVDEDGTPLAGTGVILSGMRRHTAIGILIEDGRANGLAEAVKYRPFRGSLQQAKLEALAENIQHRALNGAELANSMFALIEGGLKQKDVAAKLHKTDGWVSKILGAFRKATPEVRNAWRMGKITNEAAHDISKLPADKQDDALKEQVNARATGTKGAIGKARTGGKTKSGTKHALKLSELNDRLEDLTDVPEDRSYLHGLADAFKHASGLLKEKDLSKPYHDHVKRVRAQRERDAMAAKTSEKPAKSQKAKGTAAKRKKA